MHKTKMEAMRSPQKNTFDKVQAFLDTKKKLKLEARKEIRRLQKEGQMFTEIGKLNFINQFVFERMTEKPS
ncbi:hypothetical protein [Herbaspirillum sp. ST 5-3]|uniref:hypothetical protein n=1 Tax=Oxalobacteraceae TaxID=75682 RepID=UPI0010A453C7|nr:hypothetical protein [Herbaspirillum sp. ST 5-3]